MVEELLVPQYVTQWGVLTSFVLLGFSFLTYKYKYYLLSILSLCVFISSVLHWHKMTLFGSTKVVDFILAASAFLLVTFYYNDILKGKYKRIWYITAAVTVAIFLFNWVITYFQILNKDKTTEEKEQSEYKYFSLDYTQPNTLQRELCYYYVTFVHLIFVHIVPSVVLAYCFIMSHSTF
jgi:hypothetical protein